MSTKAKKSKFSSKIRSRRMRKRMPADHEQEKTKTELSILEFRIRSR